MILIQWETVIYDQVFVFFVLYNRKHIFSALYNRESHFFRIV